MGVRPDKLHAESSAALCWALHGELLVILASPDPIDDELFDQFIADVQTHPWKKCLGASLGSLDINSTQRSVIAKHFRGKRTAALADNAVARGIATALRWLGMEISAWSWADIDKAIEYLQLDPKGRVAARELMKLLREAKEK